MASMFERSRPLGSSSGRPWPGRISAHVEGLKPPERVEMLCDRIRREAQVEERGEHRADHVAHHQEPLPGQMEADLRRRVARGLDHLEVTERSRDPGSLAQRLVGNQVAVDAVRLLPNVRHLGHDRLRHPEPARQVLALGAMPLGVAERAEEVLAFRGRPDAAARALRHSRRRAEVVGVQVGDHQIAHVGQPPAACGERMIHRLEPAGVAPAAGVHEHHGPVRAVQRVGVRVAYLRPGGGQPEPPEPLRHLPRRGRRRVDGPARGRRADHLRRAGRARG